MSFLDASAAGLQLADASSEVLPVDFVSTGGGYTLVAVTGWWRAATPGVGEGLFWFMDHPLPRGPRTWVLVRQGGHVVLQVLSSQTAHVAWTAGRLDQDVHRADYLEALRLLAAEFTEQQGILPWRDRFTARPVVNPAAQVRARYTAPRTVGVLPLHDGEGTVVDMLALDELGTAESAHGDVWLEALASQWVRADARPDPLTFLTWAAGQRPHGFRYPGTPRILTAKGSTKGIAGQALAGIL